MTFINSDMKKEKIAILVKRVKNPPRSDLYVVSPLYVRFIGCP